jgi:predicted AlkP superfamily phosphohydrolase/phosphomutase
MKRQVFIIGLDGATFDIINPLIEEGYMPCLKKLIAKGAYGPLKSTIPPISGPAWLSLATGLRPESTAIYDFCCRKDKRNFRLSSLSSSDYKGRAVWDYLSNAGKRVLIINFPMCIPPYRVNGFMSAGIGASRKGEFTYPPEFGEELDRLAGGFYEISIPYHDRCYNDTELFLNDLQRVLSKKIQVTKCLLKEKRWDFFWVVFSETDWLQHIMWRHIDESHPCYEGDRSRKFCRKFKQIWSLIDEAIGRFSAIVGEDTNMFIHSDHGFGANSGVFKLNVWLEKEGYLNWRGGHDVILSQAKKSIFAFCETVSKRINPYRLAPGLHRLARRAKNMFAYSVIDRLDLERSRAFDPGHTIPFGGIYINSEIVGSAAEKRILIGEIAGRLYDWGKANNVKVDIWHKDSSCDGESETGPDLIVGMDDWECVVIKDRLKGKVFERRPYSSRHTGSHRMNGIFIAAGPDVHYRKLPCVNIHELAPVILHLFNQPIPFNMDGRLIKQIFNDEYLKKHPPELMVEKPFDRIHRIGENRKNLPVHDEAAVQKRLRGLGYL